MKKNWHLGRSQYEHVVQIMHDHGILVYGTFVLGYDDDTIEVFDKCLEFAERAGLFLAAFNLLTPLPQTGIYNHLKNQGRLFRNPWWLSPETRFCRAIFQPSKMTREAYENEAYRIRSRFYSLRSIFSRALRTKYVRRSPSKLAFYLTVNLIYRSEVQRLHAKPFGDDTDLSILDGFADLQ